MKMKMQQIDDIITRVFQEKINISKDELLKKNIIGKVIAFIYVIKFQKRELPHIVINYLILN